MKTIGGGAIVNIGSTSGYFGAPGGAAYDTSKGALGALTRQAASSCMKPGYRVRVDNVQVGNVWTDLIRRRPVDRYASEEVAIQELSTAVLLGQLASPGGVA